MLERVRAIPNLLRGRYVYIPEMTKCYDGVNEEDVRLELESLVDSGVLVKMTRNYYVVAPFDSEEEITEEIMNLSNRLYNMADTRTEVQISGSMVEEKSFKTEKSPSELIR